MNTLFKHAILPDSNCLESVSMPVHHALILICEKCGNKIAQENLLPQNPAVSLRQTLKEAIQKCLPEKTTRAVLTGCLGICPKDSISIGIIPLDTSSNPHFYILPKEKLDQAVEVLLAV